MRRGASRREVRHAVKHLRQDAVVSANDAPRTRVPYWDNVKLILIFFVALGHFLYARTDLALPKLLTIGIYTFHMPAFALVSGYFSTSERARSREQICRLLAAYVTFNGLFILWAAFRGSDVFVTIPYYSFWYLIALVIWRLTVPHVAGVPGSLVWTSIAALVAGFFPDAGNAFAFSRIVAFYPFFLAGYLARERGLGERLVSMKVAPKLLLALVCWAITIGGYWFANRYLHFDYANTEMNSYERMYDVIPRAVVLALAVAGTLAVLFSAPRMHLPLLTTIGANSLAVYLLHRYVVLAYERLLAPNYDERMLIITSLVGSVAVLVLLGNNYVARLVGSYLDAAASIIVREDRRGGFVSILWRGICVLVVVAVAAAPVYAMRRGDSAGSSAKSYEIYPRLTAEQEAAADDAYTILFAGDLTLLEDQVRRAYTGDGYDFDPVFQYTKPYIEKADLAIGVLEGPVAGKEAGYSSGNFDDTKPFWLNFPDEFAAAIKDAGFDLVTTATNHILDRGEEGAYRTLDVLDSLGLAHTGSYRDAAEKEAGRVRIIEQGGMKLAVLAYTYGVNDDINDRPDEEFVTGEHASLTSTIVDPTSSSFGAVKEAVEADFAAAKAAGADLIVVLPHWGTQFTNVPDEFQIAWRDIFIDLGADLILGAHSHDVQPIVMEEVNGRQTLTCYCPGNYCDLYREDDGDCSVLLEVKVDKASKEILGGSIIPLWTETQLDGNYRAVPVGDIVTDKTLRASMTNYDLIRVDEVQQLATSVMLGTKLDLQMARVRQPFTADGFARASVPQLKLTDEERGHTLAKALTSAKNVCFVGDWVTEGTRNGGYGWYEPIESLVSGKVSRVADVASTSLTLAAQADQLVGTGADLFVVAVGANDVRYGTDPEAAQTPEAYVTALGELVSAVRAELPEARFVFVAPWTSVAGDMGTALMLDEKRELNAKYAAALKSWCAAEGHDYIDPNGAIEAVVDYYPDTAYLVDSTQPNCTTGIELYARAALAA